MANNLIVCGGTFDHFHKGHEAFLSYVFSVGKKILVGVTSDEYIKSSKFPSSVGRRVQNLKSIESFEERKQAVLKFVKKEKVFNKVEIIKIDDLFGPTLSKKLSIDAIVISRDTKKGADIINERRKKLGLKELNFLISPQALAEDGKIISSARIRNGEINRKGKLYVKPLWLKTNLALPENLRQKLKEPFGELCQKIALENGSSSPYLITVGDVTSKIFNEKSLDQNLSVIDFKVAREKKFVNIKELGFVGDEVIFNADNPAGLITSSLFLKLIEIFKLRIKKKEILQINGEDDLVVLPLILTVPLNTLIYYGQPPLCQGFEGQPGLVKILVSEDAKEQAYNLVLKFRPI
ncbi:MAG: pantetheine-phosphate adenylyltransferase [Candidatus Levybacteria bacterium]|nr:pantetheine-phosphate adenylyltransferase [Candidatus Levybacteria bacterium]